MSSVNLNTLLGLNPLYTGTSGDGSAATSPVSDPLLQPAETGLNDGIFQTGQGTLTANSALFQTLAQSITSTLQTAQVAGNTVDPSQLVSQALNQVLQQSAGTAQGNQSNTSDSSTSTTLQQFNQTLLQSGIDPQQFQSDFLSAVQQAQSGTADSAVAFSSFPPGLTLDTTA